MRTSDLATNGHRLKILDDFADAVVMGNKNFEIRKNDRGFQKGDVVVFNCIDKTGKTIPHGINGKIYEITYVLNGWGIKNGYVVFGIKEIAKIIKDGGKDGIII